VAAVERCLQYINEMRHFTLLFPYGSEKFIAEFSDSYYGNYIDSQRSVSDYLIKLRNSTISWRSQIQISVSTSTTGAEYVALLIAATYFFWLITALIDLQFPEILMALLYEDHCANDLAKNHWISGLTKYIDIYHHRVQELVYDTTLLLMYIRTTNTLADISTQGLSEIQLSKLHAIALVYNKRRC
jgi:hypothetical protein